MARLKAGDKFPDFQFHTAYDLDLGTLDTIKKTKKTVFWVLRYVGCTTCRYDIHIIKERYKEFAGLGAQVLVVLQSQPEIVQADLKGDEVPYEIICDPDQLIYKRFSIDPAPDKESRQPKEAADQERWQKKLETVKASGFVHGKYEGDENQLPALFIIGQDTVVQYAHYAQHSIDMPNGNELLAQLH
jgi:peroxiredoxin